MIRINILVLCLLLSVRLLAQKNPAPSQVKFYQHGEFKSNGETVSKAIIHDGKNYVLLNIVDSSDLDYGAGTSYFSPEFPGNFAMVLACYDNSGAYLWAKILGQGTTTQFGANFVLGEDMQLIGNNLVINGTANGVVQLDPARSAAGSFSVNSKSFVASYTLEGNFNWARVQQTGFAFYRKVQSNKENEVVCILGYCAGVADINPGSGTVLVGGGNTTVYSTFVLVLNNNGDYVNHYALEPNFGTTNPGSTLPTDLVVLGSRSPVFILSGTYTGSITDSNGVSLSVGENINGAFVISASQAGGNTVKLQMESSEPLGGPNFALSTFMGEITGYQILGTYSKELKINGQIFPGYASNNKDLYLAKFNAFDSLLWIKTIAEAGSTEGLKIAAGRFNLPGASEASNMIVVGGSTIRSGSIGDDLDPSASELRIASPAAAFILFFSDSGELLMHNKIERLQATQFEFRSLDIDYLGGMILTANFQGSLEVDDFPFLSDTVKSTQGTIDLIVSRYHYCTDVISIERDEQELRVTDAGVIKGAEYTWINIENGKIVQKSFEPTFTPLETGSYLSIRLADGCRAISNTFKVTLTSVKETNRKQGLVTGYPNPTENEINFVSDLKDNPNTVNIYSLAGTLVKTIN